MAVYVHHPPLNRIAQFDARHVPRLRIFGGQALSHRRVSKQLKRTLPEPHTLQSFMNPSFSCLTRISRLCLRVPSSPEKSILLTRTRLQTKRAFSQTCNMAAAASSLSEKLKSLSLAEPLPKYPNCFPEVNPVDIYRAHLTSILTEVTGVEASIIYPALQWTQTLEKGDLVLPVPALRVKGKKPPELAAEWVKKV